MASNPSLCLASTFASGVCMYWRHRMITSFDTLDEMNTPNDFGIIGICSVGSILNPTNNKQAFKTNDEVYVDVETWIKECFRDYKEKFFGEDIHEKTGILNPLPPQIVPLLSCTDLLNVLICSTKTCADACVPAFDQPRMMSRTRGHSAANAGKLGDSPLISLWTMTRRPPGFAGSSQMATSTGNVRSLRRRCTRLRCAESCWMMLYQEDGV